MTRIATILGLVLLLAVPAMAQPPELRGRWRSSGKTQRFTLSSGLGGAYVGTTLSPVGRAFVRLELSENDDGTWTLKLSRLSSSVGLSGRLQGRSSEAEWLADRSVTLRRRGTKLSSKRDTFRVTLPHDLDPQAIGSVTQGGRADTAPVESPDLPVVKVLITGFDRFPRLKNHPRWVQDGQLTTSEPRINPAGWVVRQFTLDDLSEEFRGKVKIELHKCLDVPVTYVEGAKVITDTIEQLSPDVVIAFGVGADSGSADVEKTCRNVMDDSWLAVADQGQGPFQLPADWPPREDRAEWSEEDKLWLSRYPDNAGVSYNGAKIDPQGPERLSSLLPVDRIVSRVQREDLHAIDGGSGPGRYICNNVMYKVIQSQSKNEKLGGFIHLAQWSESRRDNYLKVVACAVEESASAWLESRRAADLAGLPARSRRQVAQRASQQARQPQTLDD